MSINDPAEFLEQLAAEVASLNDRLDAAGIASLEALLTPQSTEPRIGAVSTPTASIGGGDVTQTAVLAPSSVVTDSIASGAITMPKIAANAVDMTKFAQAIIPPRVVLELPTLPDDNYPVGSIVFLTSDETLYKNVAGTWTATTEADLVANTLYAGAITAGAIGARELATVILLSSLIKTANSGARVEIDVNGIRCIASDNVLLVNIPTDPDEDVYVRAEVRALGLLVYDNAVFQGAANVLAAGSSTTLASVQENPSVKPTLVQGWESFSLTGDGFYPQIDDDGLVLSAAGGAGGSTRCFYGIENLSVATLVEWLASDGSRNRTLALDDDFPSTPVTGFTVHGAYIYVCDWDGLVKRYNMSDLSLANTYSSVSLPVASPRYPHMASDGTYIYIVDNDNTGYVAWNKYDSSMVKQGSTVTSAYDIGDVGSGARITGCAAGQFDFGADRVVITVTAATDSSTAHVFDSSGVHQTNECFPVAGSYPGGVCYGSRDGVEASRFFSQAATGTETTITITVHSTWAWTTESSVYWVAYSWYDSDTTGGTHETLVGPLQSVTMGKRKRLQVTTPTEPGAGGTDDPNSRRIYMYPNATSPATTSLKLQATTADESYYVTAYDSGGAAPPTSNDFPGGTAAVLKSAGGEWQLEGDGTAAFGAVAITGDITGVPLTGSDTVFTITGGGGATYTSKNCEYVKIGRLVVFNLRWVVNAAGSGTTALSITSEDTGLPKAAGSFVAMGDHGGSGANRILARMQNGTNELTVLNIAEVGAPTTNETGAELLAGSTWSIMGAYISES